MNQYIQLLENKDKKKLLFFILLNIFVVFFETFSLALVPIFIDFVINPTPILPQYFLIHQNLFDFENKDNVILISSILFVSFFIIKNIFILGVIFYEANLTQRFHYFLKRKYLSLYLFAPFQIINSYKTSQILRNTDTETQNYVTNIFLIAKVSKDFLLFISIKI